MAACRHRPQWCLKSVIFTLIAFSMTKSPYIPKTSSISHLKCNLWAVGLLDPPQSCEISKSPVLVGLTLSIFLWVYFPSYLIKSPSTTLHRRKCFSKQSQQHITTNSSTMQFTSVPWILVLLLHQRIKYSLLIPYPRLAFSQPRITFPASNVTF